MTNKIVIIPTYNEKENVRKIAKAVRELPEEFDILFVDDGSPDGTGDIIKDMQKSDDHIHLIEREGKLGLGTAYITGFRYCLEKGYEFICEMDADFSHKPTDLPRLVKACENDIYDIAIGSRYVRGGGVENWGLDRKVLSYGASLYVRFITLMNIKDPTAGFVCYKREVLETLDLDKITFVGYAFQIEMKFAAWTLGFRLKEVPIIFTDRVEGVSKMSSNIIGEAVWGVLKMKWLSFFKSYWKKER
ncbi:MAG TPA: polyprenol monophosphomannose synthase [Saprospiraceae bacterium]|nr:polyprenol monophosphomannose synthase [Saprospiraceae bacterium]